MVISPQATPGSWKTRRKSPSARAPSPPPPTGCRPRRPRPKLARRRPCRRPRWGKRVGKVGKSLGILRDPIAKNCGDDLEISWFWWNWIGNMWIYHDLSGNICYLRWLYNQTRVRSWRANIEYTGWEFHRRWGFGGQKIQAVWGKSFWEALATKGQTSRCFMLMAFSGTSFGHIPFDSPFFSSRLGLKHHTGWHLDHV